MTRSASLLVVALVLCGLSSGCRISHTPARPIAGREFDVERARQVTPGMTPEQVRALIGRPWEERQDAGQVVWRYYVRYESRQLLELLGVIPVKETPAYGALEAKITFDRGVVRATVVK
jgi:outer membrane protein assembly factor BamE (lipoprotein component of BamABCDE complex)